MFESITLMVDGMSRSLDLACIYSFGSYSKDVVIALHFQPPVPDVHIGPSDYACHAILFVGCRLLRKSSPGWVDMILGQPSASISIEEASERASCLQHLSYLERPLVLNGPRLGAFEPSDSPFTETLGAARVSGELAKASPD